MSRLGDLAEKGDYEGLEGLWLDMLPGSLDPVEASEALCILVRNGQASRASGLLEIALEETDRSERTASLLELCAPCFGVDENLRAHLVEMLRDRHIMLGPLERYLSDSGLLTPGCIVSEAWAGFSKLLRFAEENWVVHPVLGAGRIRRIGRTSATVDFSSSRNHDISLDNLLSTTAPAAPDDVAVLRRIDPAAFSALCADPASLLEKLLDEGGGRVERQSLGPVLGEEAASLWKSMREAARPAVGLLESPDVIERVRGGGLEEALRAMLKLKRPLSEKVERAAAMLRAAPEEEQTAAASALLADMPDPRSVEAGARFELHWTLLQISGGDPGSLSGLVDPVPVRALQALSEIGTPRCRKDYIALWVSKVQTHALEELVKHLPAGQRPMLLEAAASSHPGWADGFLRELVFHGSDPDLLLWAASVLLAEGLESPEETRAVIRAALDSIPRGRADNQRRASRTIVEKAGDELRSFLAGLDARKLSNLSGLLDECGPAHETGLCLEIRRESSGRSADSGRAYYFWESDFVFDSPGAIRRRAEAIEKLRTVEIPAAAEAVGEAAAHGDLSENAEYKAALERRDLLLERLSRWSDEFGRLRPYPSGDISSSVSSPGTGVRLEGADGEITFHLTGPVEARPEDGRVNYLAPLGAALLGRRRGEEIELPGRDGVFTVRDIFPLPGEEEA